MKITRSRHFSLVTWGEWGVSTTFPAVFEEGGYRLNLYRSRIKGKELPVEKWPRGFGDGRIFVTKEAADQWAFDHGYLQVYFTPSVLRARRVERAYNPIKSHA